jgi:peptide/nickel transport system substrate-binding protein
MYSLSVQYSAKSLSVHPALPLGEGLSAAAITCASKPPVIFEICGGVIRVFRFNAASKTRFDWKAGYNGFLAGYAVEFDPDGAYANFVPKASQNTMAYSNPETDELLKLGRRTLDPAKRREIYGGFEVAYAKNPGHLLIAYLDGNYVSTAGLKGLDTTRVLGHHAVGVMWNIEEWVLTR